MSCKRGLEDGHRVCPDDGAPLETVFEGSPVLDGKYHLLRRVGGGGMGRVYKARHLGLKRLVSVKILRPRFRTDRGFQERFEREAEALGRLRHDHVVEVSDFGIEGARRIPYLVMEYLAGRSLAERLRSGALPVASALPIFEQIASALEHAHRSGILHRDLKPSNVFLSEAPGTTPRVKVLDFGLARFFSDPDRTPEIAEETIAMAAADANPAVANDHGVPKDEDSTLVRPPGDRPEAAATALLGTPGYMSPEVLRGQTPTPASDLYAFGVLIYRCLAGCPPFQGSLAELLEMHRSQQPLPPSTLAPRLAKELDAPILAALRKEPRRRPPNASALVADLRQALLAARQSRWWQRESVRRMALAASLGAAAILLTSAFEGPLRWLEDRLVDARFTWSTPRPPTQPLLLVLIDDATLAADPTPLADRGQEAGELLSRVMAAGATGVGIDLLLPERWGHATAFSDFVLRHADSLALAAFSPAEGEVIGPEVIHGLTTAALGPQRARRLFGFVNLDQGTDGVVRHARTRYVDVEGHSRPSFAARAAEISRGAAAPPGVQPPLTFRIDYSLDWRQLDRISWSELAATLEREPERFTDRLILVGAIYAGADGPYRVPHPRSLQGEIPGPILQALTLHTLLDQPPERALGQTSPPLRPTAPGGTLAAAGLLATLGAAAVLLGRRLLIAGSLGLALALGWLTVAMALFRHDTLLLPAAPFLAALLATFGIAFALRQRLTRFPE
ncbi:MAG: protein kinase [Acidobacteriota bacterium]